MGTTGGERLAQMVVDLVDGVDEGDPEPYLTLLARHAAECAGGVAVGLLTWGTDGGAGVVAGSDERARTLELRQRQAGEGPGHDVLGGSRGDVAVPLARAVQRWPVFAPAALDAGFAVVHTVPLRGREEVVGALDLLAVQGQVVRAPQLRVVQALAHLATATLLRARDLGQARRLAAQLQEALTSRIPIEQAKGALAQVHAVGPEAAFELLRAYARRHRRSVAEVAAGWLAHPEQFPGLGAGATSSC